MTRARNISPQTRLLLSVLSRQLQAWRHGYDLSRETGLKSGTLYPLLMRLRDQGLLESEWRQPLEPGRPPRHVHRLTATGAALAASQAAPHGASAPRSAPAGLAASS